ncbi:hypothetical protein VDP83_21640, partial [Xanthomonas campestris pv. campestris]|nr:hypothetical protein [Xanthomonas campestris pv. campestris]
PNIWQTPISSTPDSKPGRYSGRGGVAAVLQTEWTSVEVMSDVDVSGLTSRKPRLTAPRESLWLESPAIFSSDTNDHRSLLAALPAQRQAGKQ